MAIQKFINDKRILERYVNRKQVCEDITAAVNGRQPYLAARFGSFEGRICYYSKLLNAEVPKYLVTAARRNAGICNADAAVLKRFSDIYLSAAAEANLLALFDFEGQEELAKFTQNNSYSIISSLNPLVQYESKLIPWTRSLSGRRLLVIHPFSKTIEAQLARRHEIPHLKWLFPNDLEISLIKPSNTAGRVVDIRQNWFDELNMMKDVISEQSFDVAIIGAGAYGLPLGAFIKSLGKVAIHAGGATQLYFSILGARWDRFFGENGLSSHGWVRPLDVDTPSFASRIEGGCYW